MGKKVTITLEDLSAVMEVPETQWVKRIRVLRDALQNHNPGLNFSLPEVRSVIEGKYVGPDSRVVTPADAGITEDCVFSVQVGDRRIFLVFTVVGTQPLVEDPKGYGPVMPWDEWLTGYTAFLGAPVTRNRFKVIGRI